VVSTHAYAECHRQCFCMDDLLVLPIIVQIGYKSVIQIDLLLHYAFALGHIVIIKENAGNRNLRKRLYPLIETTETIVANLCWIEFTAVVTRATIVANLISL